MKINFRLLFLLCVALFSYLFIAARVRSTSRVQARTSAAVLPVGKPITIKAPLGLPAVPVPPDNPPTDDTIALGRRL